jgi:hypothetical protein
MNGELEAGFWDVGFSSVTQNTPAVSLARLAAVALLPPPQRDIRHLRNTVKSYTITLSPFQKIYTLQWTPQALPAAGEV